MSQMSKHAGLVTWTITRFTEDATYCKERNGQQTRGSTHPRQNLRTFPVFLIKTNIFNNTKPNLQQSVMWFEQRTTDDHSSVYNRRKTGRTTNFFQGPLHECVFGITMDNNDYLTRVRSVRESIYFSRDLCGKNRGQIFSVQKEQMRLIRNFLYGFWLLASSVLTKFLVCE